MTENEEMTAEELAAMEAEQEASEAEERARLEHEAMLAAFPDSTVFFDKILGDDSARWLGARTSDPHTADSMGWLDNHLDADELVRIDGRYYLKDFTPEPDTPEQRRAKFIATRKSEIVTAVQEQLDATAHSKGYDNGEMLATYATDPDPEFGAQGRAYVAWRGKCWRKCYAILDQVLAGELEPEDVTVSFVLGALPPLEW
jgi:hypothetical protein